MADYWKSQWVVFQLVSIKRIIVTIDLAATTQSYHGCRELPSYCPAEVIPVKS